MLIAAKTISLVYYFILLFYICNQVIPNHNFTSVTIVIKNRKIVRKHEPYSWYFRFSLKYLGWPYRAYIKTAKNDNFCQELLSKSDFEAVLANFCCCDHRAKTSEEIQKIATDQKEYCKCSLCAIICWIAKIYPSINNSEKWLVTGILPT